MYEQFNFWLCFTMRSIDSFNFLLLLIKYYVICFWSALNLAVFLCHYIYFFIINVVCFCLYHFHLPFVVNAFIFIYVFLDGWKHVGVQLQICLWPDEMLNFAKKRKEKKKRALGLKTLQPIDFWIWFTFDERSSYCII